MPENTDADKRNKAIFAFLMLTGARDGAMLSLRLTYINFTDRCVYHDAREVRAKNSKTITAHLLSVDDA